MGEKGGAGHFWRNDRLIWKGGERNWMQKAELEKVLRLLSFGEKFQAFLRDKRRKLKQKIRFLIIGKSPKLDGRCNSKLLGNIVEEMANISFFGSAKKVKIKI